MMWKKLDQVDKKLKDVRVIGVERLDNYDACLKCSNKLMN